MTDDLVQRLRRTYRKEFPVTGSMIADNSNRLRPFPILAAEVPFNPDGHEAADRIEALQADKAKMREALQFYAAWGVTSPAYDDAIREDGGDRARTALQDTER